MEAKQRFELLLRSVKTGVETIGTQLAPDADWHPTMFCSKEGTETIVALPDLMNEELKDAVFFRIMPALVRELRPEVCAMVATAWGLRMPPLEDGSPRDLADVPRPSESPERIELVMVTISDGQRYEMHWAEITRHEHEHPTLSWREPYKGQPDPEADKTRPWFEALQEVNRP